ncbi:hypothetical protein JOE48_002699 [Methylobacterium sp. PvR107]|nr:hypothetical protein [Methylobacterium sp. PvR107]MBP1180735.1 hypothetical protein [Methylobacterium sp. PvR107]
MQSLFSTAGLHPRNSFQRWQEFLLEQPVPLEQTRLDPGSFEGRLDAAEIGPLLMTRISQGSKRSAVTPATIRRFDKGDTRVVIVKLAGVLATQPDERPCLQRQGDLLVLDHRPVVLTSGAASQSKFLEPLRAPGQGAGPVSALYGPDGRPEPRRRGAHHELRRIRRHRAPSRAWPGSAWS